MNKTIIKLEGYTHADRNEMIWRAKEAIRNGGAFILDSRAFSELAFCFNFEVTALNLENWRLN
ncbi:MAG: hypothetical protein HKN33_09720 [Pyrinomonadaceae bacterium]|nr:hypothetical protein [Pyrinomonadaceae bacterium]